MWSQSSCFNFKSAFEKCFKMIIEIWAILHLAAEYFSHTLWNNFHSALNLMIWGLLCETRRCSSKTLYISGEIDLMSEIVYDAYAKKKMWFIFFRPFSAIFLLLLVNFVFWQMMMNHKIRKFRLMLKSSKSFFLLSSSSLHYELNSMLFYASHAESGEKYMRILLN